MSIALAQISNHIAAVVLCTEAFPLYSDGHRVLGSVSLVLGVALLAGFYGWNLYRTIRKTVFSD
jgi:hypothetical protein